MMIQAQQATLLPPPASGFWSSTVPHCGLYSVSLVGGFLFCYIAHKWKQHGGFVPQFSTHGMFVKITTIISTD